MRWEKTVFLGLVAGAVLSVSAPAQVPVRPGARRPRVEPCWQVAGIPKSAFQQRRLIAQRTRQQVEAVCANSSLSLLQKREEIKQIHERARQEMEALITPAQQSALKACQQGRGHRGVGHGGHGRRGGPCGEVLGSHHPFAEDEEDERDEKPPNEAPKPN